MSRWYIAVRESGSRKYLRRVNVNAPVEWTDDVNEAHRFDTKADAVMVQMELVAELGVEAACISDCPRPAK
jgi:hypothetical protein